MGNDDLRIVQRLPIDRRTLICESDVILFNRFQRRLLKAVPEGIITLT